MRILEFCNKFRRIYIYGAGEYGRTVCIYLEEHIPNMTGFVVSELDKKQSVLGKEVFGLESITDEIISDDVGIIIAVSENLHSAISGKLSDKGIRNIYPLQNKELKIIRESISFTKEYPICNSVNVFCYHRVCNIPLDSRKLAVTPSFFEEQLKYLKEEYNVLRSDDEWDISGGRAACITFDDGYVDFYTDILPILEKYEVPATVFVATGNIDTDQEFWGDELERYIYYSAEGICGFELDNQYFLLNQESKLNTLMKIREILMRVDMVTRKELLSEISKKTKPIIPRRVSHRTMTADEIKKCSESKYVTIGAHTVSHCCLSSEKESTQRTEIQDSKAFLESLIGRNVDVFAYPYGGKKDFTSITTDIVCKAGFTKCFTTITGLHKDGANLLGVPRNSIATCNSMDEVIRKIRLMDRIYIDEYV